LSRDIARTLRALDDGATVDASLRAMRNSDYKHRIAALHALELFADPDTADTVRSRCTIRWAACAALRWRAGAHRPRP
jgi:hypothetical protein